MKTDMGQEAKAMPLGIEQNNHLLNLTLDVWQDQIFFNDSAFPAGYFAADILNVSDETMRELLTHGGEISFQVEALANAGHEEFIKLLPETRTSMEKLLDALWKCPPYSFWKRGRISRHWTSCSIPNLSTSC